MRSHIAKRILDNTPKETKIFVRVYTKIKVKINKMLKDRE